MRGRRIRASEYDLTFREKIGLLFKARLMCDQVVHKGERVCEAGPQALARMLNSLRGGVSQNKSIDLRFLMI